MGKQLMWELGNGNNGLKFCCLHFNLTVLQFKFFATPSIAEKGGTSVYTWHKLKSVALKS